MSTWTLPPPTLLGPGGIEKLVGAARRPLTPALGITSRGDPVAADIALLPHLAVVGTSGSGKTNLIHVLLATLLHVATPRDLRFLMLDSTGELDSYIGIPHLIQEPIDDPRVAVGGLEKLGEVLERRYERFRANGVRNVSDYNQIPGLHMPRIFCVTDEFAALMMGGERRRVEEAVAAIGIRGRKAGIHLLLSAQIPHREVFTPTIKANLTGRIALQLPSGVFSRVALDENGAEDLLEPGEGLLRDGRHPQLIHFQAPLMPPQDTQTLVDWWAAHPPAPEMAAFRSRRSPAISVPSVPLRPTVRADRSRPARSRPRRRRRPFRKVRTFFALLVVAVFAAAALAVVSVHTQQCPSGLKFDEAVLTQTCDRPNGSVACVLGASGFAAVPGRPGEQMTSRPLGSSWCPGAGRS